MRSTRSLLVFIATLVAVSCLAVDLQWDIPADLSGISGYEVHYGPTSQTYTDIHDVPGETTDQTTIPDQASGDRYYAVRSRNVDATQFSTFSNEVVHAIQGPTSPLDPVNVSVIYVSTGGGQPMAISYLGYDQIESTANYSSGAVTIDSSADTIIVFVVAHHGLNSGTHHFDELNFDNGTTVDFTHVDSAVYLSDPTASMYYMTANSSDWPGTGAKTLYWDAVGGSNWNAGMTIVLSYWSGIHQTDSLRDSDKHELEGITATEESALAGVVSTDMSVGVAWAYNQTPNADPATYGQTAIVEDLYNGFGIGVQYESGEDVLRFENLVAGDASCIWAAFKAAPSAGLSIPVASHHYTKNIGP